MEKIPKYKAEAHHYILRTLEVVKSYLGNTSRNEPDYSYTISRREQEKHLWEITFRLPRAGLVFYVRLNERTGSLHLSFPSRSKIDKTSPLFATVEGVLQERYNPLLKSVKQLFFRYPLTGKPYKQGSLRSNGFEVRSGVGYPVSFGPTGLVYFKPFPLYCSSL